MNKDKFNPWAGLASYEDPETAERKLKFCGRDNDSYDVAKLIMSNIFVTLYGKSGIGKTSLLNAGVFPELREEQYTPISLRLGIRDEEHLKSYQDIIIEAVERTVEQVEAIDVIPEEKNQHSVDYLWKYFVNHHFYDKNESQTTPVIVLDQFEEVYRGHRQEVEALLRQLDNCAVNGLSRRYETNIRIVVAIREDDLYRLEDSIENCYLPALKRNRFRLHSLSEDGARDAIQIPGEGLFKADEQEEIVNTIINIARNKEDQSISTNLLSLVCSRIYADFQRSDAEHITLTLVESFIKGNPFERFYNEATQGLSNNERNYIEDSFVDSTGRRNSVPESDFLLHVKKGLKLIESDNHILQRVTISSNETNCRIELIHDSFCEPLLRQKEKRAQRRRLKFFLFCIIGTLCVVGVTWYYLSLLIEANNKMKENEIRFIAEKSQILTDNGDSYTARLLALEILPENLQHPNRPYLPEAEAALRYASDYNTSIIKENNGPVYQALYSHDDRYIIASSADSTVRIWDALSHKCLYILRGQKSYIHSLAMTSDGKHIISGDWDGSIAIWNFVTKKYERIISAFSSNFYPIHSIDINTEKGIFITTNGTKINMWDLKTGKRIKSIGEHSNSILNIKFSPDYKYIVSTSEKEIKIWNVENGNCIRTFSEKKDAYFSASYSPDGEKIVSTLSDNSIKIWNIKTGECVKVLKGHTNDVRDANYSPDGSKIVSCSLDATIRIWNVEEGTCEKILKGHTLLIFTSKYSHDGKYIISGGSDGTIRTWDANSTSSPESIHLNREPINVAYSPNGKQIIISSQDSLIRIYDTTTNEIIFKLEGHNSQINNAIFNHGGTLIASASKDSTIRIWDYKTKNCLFVLKHKGAVNDICFSPDDRLLASTSEDKTLKIWNIDNGNCIRSYAYSTVPFGSIAFSPDGRYLASISLQNSLYLWDVKSGNLITNIGTTFKLYIGNSILFTKDNQYIIYSSYSDKDIYMYNLSGEIVRCFEGHTARVYDLAISPDGKYLASTSFDSTLKFWDISTGVCVKTEQYPFPSLSIAYHPEGKIVTMCCSPTNDVTFGYFPPLQELIDNSRERFKGRKLTPAERKKYYLE